MDIRKPAIKKPAILGRIARSALRATQTKPSFLLIGAQKSGTTALYHYLLNHPRLKGPRTHKEIHYFNIYYHKGLEWYLSHFPRKLSHSRALFFEATPDYLCHPTAADRIHNQLGEMPLIAVLRDPAQRAYSAWNMWHYSMTSPEKQHKTDHRSFAQAIEEELAAETREQNFPYFYVDMGRYADHIERFREFFPQNKMLFLKYDQMDADLEGFLNSICDFLQINPFRRETVDELRGQRYWVGKKKSRSSEEQETIERLNEYYAPYNQRLAELTGIQYPSES